MGPVYNRLVSFKSSAFFLFSFVAISAMLALPLQSVRALANGDSNRAAAKTAEKAVSAAGTFTLRGSSERCRKLSIEMPTGGTEPILKKAGLPTLMPSEDTPLVYAGGAIAPIPGALDADDMTYNRLIGDCGPLSGAGTAVFYDTISITNTLAGPAIFTAFTSDPGSPGTCAVSVDTLLFAYAPAFIPAMPTVGCVTSNDDGGGPAVGTCSGITFTVPAAGTAQIVITSFGNGAMFAYDVNFLGASASAVTVGGKVLNAKGRPVRNAMVQMTGPTGQVFTARSNHFGYFNLYGVDAGQTYVFTVSHKQFRFSSEILDVNDSIRDLVFVAEN